MKTRVNMTGVEQAACVYVYDGLGAHVPRCSAMVWKWRLTKLPFPIPRLLNQKIPRVPSDPVFEPLLGCRRVDMRTSPSAARRPAIHASDPAAQTIHQVSG